MLYCFRKAILKIKPQYCIFMIRYYLEETDGDMKAAVQLARLDDSWEHVAGSRTGRRHFFHSVLGQA